MGLVIPGKTKLMGSANKLYWDDLRIAASATRLNPAVTKPDFGTFIDGLLTYLFDPAALESVHFAAQIPHGYKFGTNLLPHVHWAPMTTHAGGVVWGFEYTIANMGDTFPSSATTYIRQVGSGTALDHQTIALPAISGTGITSLSSMLICRLFRDADGSGGSGLTDDYTGDAAFLEFDFHYQFDAPGSTQELVK